jgi:hypothetical protein
LVKTLKTPYSKNVAILVLSCTSTEVWYPAQDQLAS